MKIAIAIKKVTTGKAYVGEQVTMPGIKTPLAAEGDLRRGHPGDVDLTSGSVLHTGDDPAGGVDDARNSGGRAADHRQPVLDGPEHVVGQVLVVAGQGIGVGLVGLPDDEIDPPQGQTADPAPGTCSRSRSGRRSRNAGLEDRLFLSRSAIGHLGGDNPIGPRDHVAGGQVFIERQQPHLVVAGHQPAGR